MANKEVKSMLPYNLQFFGGNDKGGNPDEESGKKGDSGVEDNDDPEEDEEDSDDEEPEEKTFTQAEVTAMMTAEKKKGKRAMLKALGFKDEKEAQGVLKGYRDYLETQKSDEDKKNEREEELKSSKSAAEKRAEAAENKLTCIMAGVNKESIDDVLAIAMVKVEEDDDLELEDVLEQMKTQKKYKGFFDVDKDDSGDDEGKEKGTGRGPGKDRKKPEVPENYGRSLAEKQLQSRGQKEGKKSSYFSR